MRVCLYTYTYTPTRTLIVEAEVVQLGADGGGAAVAQQESHFPEEDAGVVQRGDHAIIGQNLEFPADDIKEGVAAVVLSKNDVARFEFDQFAVHEALGNAAVGVFHVGDAQADLVADLVVEKIELSQLIDILNERFGTEFKPGDQLFFDSIKEDAVTDDSIRQAAIANDKENFGYVFLKALEDLFIDRMDQNEEITAKFMNEPEFKKAVGKHLLDQVYEHIHASESS